MISHFAPGVLTNYGEALRKSAGRITGRRANMPPRCLGWWCRALGRIRRRASHQCRGI